MRGFAAGGAAWPTSVKNTAKIAAKTPRRNVIIKPSSLKPDREALRESEVFPMHHTIADHPKSALTGEGMNGVVAANPVVKVCRVVKILECRAMHGPQPPAALVIQGANRTSGVAIARDAKGHMVDPRAVQSVQHGFAAAATGLGGRIAGLEAGLMGTFGTTLGFC